MPESYKTVMRFSFLNRAGTAALFRQLIGFGIVGFFNTAINLTVYYALITPGVNYIIANAVAFIVSVFSAYYFNGRYVFGKKSGIRTIVRVYISYGLTFLVSTGLLYVLIGLFKFSEFAAPLLTLIVTIPLNFLLNRLWAFR